MCETADPVTGDKDFCSLVRISIVNGLDPSEVCTYVRVNEMRVNV